MKCELNHEQLLQEINEKRLSSGTYVCPDCGVILIVMINSIDEFIDAINNTNSITIGFSNKGLEDRFAEQLRLMGKL